MKQDPSFKLVAIIVLAGVITAFVAPELDDHQPTETRTNPAALAE